MAGVGQRSTNTVKIKHTSIRAAVLHTIVYNGVKVFNNKKSFLKHGVQNYHRLTQECVQYTMYTLIVHFEFEKCWQP